MELQLAFRFLFLTTLDLFSLKVFANVKNIEYKRTFGNDNYNDMFCGAEKSENKCVAVKIPQDSNGQCQALERDWLLNKQYDSGYDYIEKEKVVEIFNPPVEIDIVEIDRSDTYKWILPSSFDVGASLTLYVTIPTQPFYSIAMNIADTIKENLDVTDSDPEILLHHLVFRHNKGERAIQANVENAPPDESNCTETDMNDEASGSASLVPGHSAPENTIPVRVTSREETSARDDFVVKNVHRKP
ncbi:uncharacterized protein LOC123555926 [Mercenaria mercenaria]|uniref:uncharacterized protein LOC123555926 n=1 Tax=Mercenaria mercenaria TaxID=6596 RepID=UPI00234FB4C5|nr:uncharacterized protein LOC123555926 [Mercenaria mercenaria]